MAACAIIAYPSTAAAIPIHKHITTYSTAYVPDAHGYRDRVRIPEEKVIVYDVAPPDSDDDGCPDSSDSYDGPGCNPPPPPPPEPAPPPVAPAPTPTVAPAPVATSSGCVGMEAESGTAGYSAYNPSSGATGCYQIIPSTAASLGCDLSTPAGQDACKNEICATSGNGAWASSGATPCG